MASAYSAWWNVGRGARTPVVADYLKLAKYRLSGLVALTATTGYCLRSERDEDSMFGLGPKGMRELSATTVGTFLTAAAANTLNQMYEIRSDALMGRTRMRPLPSGRVSLVHAGIFAAASAASGLALLSQETNGVTTSLAAANLVLYAGAYTPLKRVSTINTWVGSIVGAIPPMLGWAAASGGDLLAERERGAWALGAYLFLWQIPHFHALAVVSRTDYAAGGLRMLAVSNPTSNAWWAKTTAAAMIPLGFAMSATGVTSDAYAFEAAALSAWMYHGSSKLALSPTSTQAARALFKASIVHLPASMALMVAHQLTARERRAREIYDTRARTVTHEATERTFYHPWHGLAPFPFLPLPLLVPTIVDVADKQPPRSEN